MNKNKLHMFKAFGLLLCAQALSFAAAGDAYVWPSYKALDYDTKSQIGDIKPPTKYNENCSGVTHKKAGKWWAFYWGDNRDSRITDVTIDSILKKYDTDFEYLYNTMGWAPDAQAQDGYYSAIYYLSSGTCAGDADYNSDVGEYVGGFQSWVAGYTAVVASFYPLYSFNTSCPYHDRVAQMDAMIHEGIHSMTNGYPGAKNAHWFQEAGNTWIQQDMFSHRNKVYSGMGFLNAATVIAPFMPIECYSGWLVDGTFGGPGAQGVNGNQRYLIGGAQYSNIFPTFLGTWLGTGVVRWIYGNAYGDTQYLLETYAKSSGFGDEGTRRLIMEFRAKLAMLDMKEWSAEMRNLLDANFGGTSYDETNRNSAYDWKMTPYTPTTNNNGVLVPDAATTPGWSGSNIIPLKVKSGATQVSATLYPEGENMTLQICYRATDGTPVYSQPVFGEGTAILRLDKTPQATNGTQMVFAVICNTDYQFTGNENIRTKHFKYTLKPEEGISGAGDAYTKWYSSFKLDYDWTNLGQGSVEPSVPQSSSSVEPKSSSSHEVITTENATEYKIPVTLPIDDDYATVKVNFDVADVAKKLGLTQSTIDKATFFAQEPDKTIITNSTANAPGHWFDKNSKVCDWGENAYVFSEANLSKGVLAIGHYPNRVNNGDTYNIVQGLSYNGKSVLFNVTVSVTNEKGSSESEHTTAVMYGVNGLATHLDLFQANGMLTVQYTIPNKDNVKISLFSGFGALIAQEITGTMNAGTHRKIIDLKELPRGTYIVKVSTGSFREVRSITITK